jgi:hypothetical protein
MNDFITENRNFIYVVNKFTALQLDKNVYGSLLIIDGELDFNADNQLREYTAIRPCSALPHAVCPALKENVVVNLYSSTLKHLDGSAAPIAQRVRNNKKMSYSVEKRGYIKHTVRMRYRWFFQPKLSQFKLFKKFFKRSLKRYRKINKNKLFVSKFRSHFPKLTGFTEKGLLKM